MPLSTASPDTTNRNCPLPLCSTISFGFTPDDLYLRGGWREGEIMRTHTRTMGSTFLYAASFPRRSPELRRTGCRADRVRQRVRRERAADRHGPGRRGPLLQPFRSRSTSASLSPV